MKREEDPQEATRVMATIWGGTLAEVAERAFWGFKSSRKWLKEFYMSFDRALYLCPSMMLVLSWGNMSLISSSGYGRKKRKKYRTTLKDCFSTRSYTNQRGGHDEEGWKFSRVLDEKLCLWMISLISFNGELWVYHCPRHHLWRSVIHRCKCIRKILEQFPLKKALSLETLSVNSISLETQLASRLVCSTMIVIRGGIISLWGYSESFSDQLLNHNFSIYLRHWELYYVQ